jgi:hypothetical protein
MRVGDYTVERELTTDLYVATHVLLPRRVLLRVVGPDRATAVAVMREACILEALCHTGVPRIYECGRAGDRTWVAVELIEGEAVTGLAPHDVIALVRDVASILEHAHARGITHGGIAGDAIALRKAGACVKSWSSARIARDYASDVLALGRLACEIASGPVPAAFSELLAEMCAEDPDARPSAGEVCTAATRIAAEAIELDDVDLVEIDLPPPISIPTPVPLRWTPAGGVSTRVIIGGVPIATIRRP